MLAIIARGYVWEGMRRDVLAWSRACDECVRNKVGRHTQQLVMHLPVPSSRFEHVHVDMVGPFPLDQQNRYILTMMDRTTRWPEAVAMPDSTTDSILQAFLATWVARFGIPRIVTSDRGAQFTSKAWTGALAKLGISSSTTTAYHPQSNGLVERFHCSLKNALRCTVTSTKSWTRSLPWVLLGLRNAPRNSHIRSRNRVRHSVARARLVFGAGILHRGDRRLATPVDKDQCRPVSAPSSRQKQVPPFSFRVQRATQL